MASMMTQTEYAAHRGVGKSAVSNWKKRGLLVFAEDPASGRLMVDAARTDAKINGAIDPMRGRPSAAFQAPSIVPMDGAADLLVSAPAPTGPSLSDARLDLILEQRSGAALKNAETARQLVPLVEAERRLAEMGRLVRERVHSAFRGLAERLAVERDPRVIMSIGEAEFDQVFATLADDAEGDLFDIDDDETDAAVADNQ